MYLVTDPKVFKDFCKDVGEIGPGVTLCNFNQIKQPRDQCTIFCEVDGDCNISLVVW